MATSISLDELRFYIEKGAWDGSPKLGQHSGTRL